MEMRIRNVHYTTRENLKKLAKAADMSVGQFLDAQYGNAEVPNPEKKVTWSVKGVSREAKKRIRDNAAKKKMPIGNYIDLLIKDQEACDAKIDRLKAVVKNALDNFS